MPGFNFESGGRRCIRPILEKYQSGKGIPEKHISMILFQIHIFTYINYCVVHDIDYIPKKVKVKATL